MGQVVSQRELILRRGEWKQAGEGVVCAYGAFDLLHPGHVRLLEQARDYGRVLVVAVQGDALVREAASRAAGSGRFAADHLPERPITPAAERAETLAALAAVDLVIEIGEPLAEFLAQLRPDVFVCGDSPADNPLTDSEAAALPALGCQLVRLPLEPAFSTSSLIERIAGNRA